MIPTGLIITLMFCSSLKLSNNLEIKPDTWSVLIRLGIPCNAMYILIKFLIDLADVLDVICPDGSFETNIYFLRSSLTLADRKIQCY